MKVHIFSNARVGTLLEISFWKAWLKSNGFILGLAVAVGLAFLFPKTGARHGGTHAEMITYVGIATILLLQGLSLGFETLRDGFQNWKMHLVIQSFTFAIFPVIGLLFNQVVPLIWTSEPESIRDGFLYLCVLPSTISTSVVLTAVARGNAVGALFNAALSNVLGVAITPAMVHFFMKETGRQTDFRQLLLKIILLTLVPFFTGMFLRSVVRKWIDSNKKWITRLSHSLILWMVYSAFCDSVMEHIWTQYEWSLTGLTFGWVMILFLGISWMVYLICRWLHFHREDWIAVYFCSVKKTLAMGVPMAVLIFGERVDLTLILLPIMFYHPLQLLVNSLLANRWSFQAR